MAELKPVAPELLAAGYVRPTEAVFREAGMKSDYVDYFTDYEAELLQDVKDGKVTFSRNVPEPIADTLPPEAEPTELPPPPAVPKQKKFRPSFVYPGFLEEYE